MRAVHYERKGPPHDVLRVGDVPRLSLALARSRVRNHASGVNLSDTKGVAHGAATTLGRSREAAAKAALANLTVSLARHLADKASGACAKALCCVVTSLPSLDRGI